MYLQEVAADPPSSSDGFFQAQQHHTVLLDSDKPSGVFRTRLNVLYGAEMVRDQSEADASIERAMGSKNAILGSQPSSGLLDTSLPLQSTFSILSVATLEVNRTFPFP